MSNITKHFWVEHHFKLVEYIKKVELSNRLILDTILLGVVGALSAQLFLFMLRIAQSFFLVHLAGYKPLGLASEGGSIAQSIGSSGLWLIPLVTTLGGIITGFLIYTFAPEAEGHGTDTAIRAFHNSGGFIRARVPFLKAIASSITLGSGGAAGREGPTALISAGVGSIYATLTNRSESDRRLLTLIGMASGLSAIFRSPIGTALFGIEVLYGGMEFETSALLYTMLGSVIAYAVNGLFVGFQPLFQFPTTIAIPGFSQYFWFVLLGIAAGFMATLLPMVFYSVRDFFRRIPVPNYIKPAIGGLAVGLLELGIPQVVGGGYGWIQQAINGDVSAGLSLVLAFGMVAALSLTISCGGSGGVFAPSLFVGAMLGAFLAHVFHQPSAALVVVGMASVFGGAARVPIATLLMVTEMTGSYKLLVPAALAVMLSYLIQSNLSSRLKYKSMYEEQVPVRSDSPAHHVEELKTALRLLKEHRVKLTEAINPLQLRDLTDLGIPVELAEHMRMITRTLKPDNPYIGQLIEPFFSSNGVKDAEVVAVIRRGDILLPESGSRYQPGDNIVAILPSKNGNSEKIPVN